MKKLLIFVMLINNAYASNRLFHLEYTSRADATPPQSVVDKPSARAGYYIMENYDLFNQPPVEEIEIWKDIPNYETCYRASNLGRIRSLDRLEYRYNNSTVKSLHNKRGIILKTKITAKNYLGVSLCKNGKIKYFSVHRLVCLTFHKNPKNKSQVNHIDGDKKNNIASNLEWCTPSENSLHALFTGLKKPLLGENNPNAKISNQTAIAIKNRCLAGESASTIMKALGVSRSRVSEIKRGVAFAHLFKNKSDV